MGSSAPRVLISCGKGETHDHREGFRSLYKRLRASGFAPSKLSPAVSDSAASSTVCGITAAALAGAAILVFGCPTQFFTAVELEVLRVFLAEGGSLLVCSAAGGEVRAGTNLNALLEGFGIKVLPDCLLAAGGRGLLPQDRPEGLGPTDAWVSGGAQARTSAASPTVWPPFVYPSGSTLAVQSPAVVLLSSGPCTHPAHRPIAACWQANGHGKLAVLGSAAVLDGSWLKAVEGNARLADWLFQWLTPGSNIVVEPQLSCATNADSASDDSQTAQVTSEPLHSSGPSSHVPSATEPPSPMPRMESTEHNKACKRPVDTWAESEQLRCCVQDDMAHIPDDISALLDETIFILAPTLLHRIAPLFEQLGVLQEPLSLIAPELDVPSPPLQAAVFPPIWREPPPPPLEMFDLDSLPSE